MNEEPTETLVAWTKVIFLTALIVFAARHFLLEPVLVHGESMMPTFENDDKIVLAKISSIENFDMIVFTAPDSQMLIKRVIGTPGDRVEMDEDRLYINGKLVKEPYLDENRKIAKQQGHLRLTEDFAEFTVPPGSYFVLGDNRMHSMDSRIFGFISQDAVLGEVKFRFSPVEHMGIVE